MTISPQNNNSSNSSRDRDTRKSFILNCFANFKNHAEYKAVMIWETIKAKIRKS